jgi:hypothetical protein
VPPTATTTTPPQSPPATTQLLAQRVAGTSTPARLSLLRAACIVLAVVFAVAGAFGVNRRAKAIDDVRTSARQLLALQDIRVRVVHADAIASSSYLVGGQEDPAQRTAYLDEIGRAGDGLVAVSVAASEADIVELSVASRLLGSYVGLVEQARASNRQGFPVGAAYQRQANAIVSNADPEAPDVVSSLRAVEDSQRDQINVGLATAHRAGAWLVLVGSLLMLALLAGSLWLAAKFHRLINVPIAAAIGVLLLLLVIGGSAQAGAVSDADAAVGGPLASADRAAQARAAAFEAQSQEALTLINRGNGAANEANWQRANDAVGKALDFGLSNEAGVAYASYADAHAEIRTLDDGGNWDKAVEISLGNEPPSTTVHAVTPFDDFDQLIGKVITLDGSNASTSLGDAVGPMGTLRNIVFLAGLGVGVLAALGFGQRLKEYR